MEEGHIFKEDYLFKVNPFGKKIYFPIAAFRGHMRLEGFIRSQLQSLFEKLEMNPQKAFDNIRRTCNHYIQIYDNEGKPGNMRLSHLTREAEKELHRTFAFFDFAQNDGRKDAQRIFQLKARAKKIYRQIQVPIKKYLDGKEIVLLDLGCGDGLVTWALRTHEQELNVKFKKTYLADVVSSRNPDHRIDEIRANESDFPFIKLPILYNRLDVPNGKTPVLFDCILMLTVLHHSADPREVFFACWERLREGGIIIVIESCVGVSENFVNGNVNTEGKNVYHCNGQTQAIKQFLNLSREEEIMYATFIDWFYNRVLHQDVLVTYNFTSPVDWNNLFTSYNQIVCKQTYCEGFDQLTVPEFHTLHVLKKE